jgi:hypothetical protein
VFTSDEEHVTKSETRQSMAELGDKILAPLQRDPQAQPDVEMLLELRKLQRSAHSLQMEKIMLNQENELMVWFITSF